VHLCLDAVSPDLVEWHLSYRCEDVNVILFGAEAQVLFFSEKIVGLEAIEWNSQRLERMEGGAGILFRRPVART